MIDKENTEALDRQRHAHNDRNLTLYLGAGVSVGNGIPTWEKLVVAMYFAAIDEQPLGSWRPYPNYLFAIAEWHLERSREPLDIVARKIRKYHSPDTFLDSLRQTLYAGFSDYDDQFMPLNASDMRSANSTLDAVASLCESNNGVRSVITYNYDELLEVALDEHPFQSIWKTQSLEPGRLPIYHVHGYVPIDSENSSTAEEIVFTEEQYHLAAQDDYSWANLVQLQAMSTSVGLMVGLSLSDRNMRRLLDAVNKPPLTGEKTFFLPLLVFAIFALTSFLARSKIRKPEQSTKLSVSISFIAFGPDSHVDHLGNLLAVFQREQSPDDPVTAAVDPTEALQGTA
jgi:hypothetical protein